MDLSKVNNIKVDGSGNILLQDVEGENITINYNDTKEFSRILNVLSKDLVDQINELISNSERKNLAFEETLNKYFNLPPGIKDLKYKLQLLVDELKIKNTKYAQDLLLENNIADSENLNTRKNRNLLRALHEEKCVLFIGPEISADENGVSLHENFYKSLAEDSEGELIYNIEEGFFQPHNDPWFNSDIREYYENKFPELNHKGRKVLEIFAQLPFRLIVSMSPDDCMHNIFEKYEKPHKYLYYDKAKIPEVKCSLEEPVLFNMLGSPIHCQSDWQYIFTYNDFYSYLKSSEITGNIKNEIRNAIHYIFIGFDFDKWYFRLLLYVLNITDQKEKKIRHLIEPSKPTEYSKSFLEKQFNISFIEGDYMNFAKEIRKSAKDAKIYFDLKSQFSKKQETILERLSDKLFDAEKLTELKEIERDLIEMNGKFI